MTDTDLFHLLDDVIVEASQSSIPWVIPDLLYYRGAFLIAGSPKVGKSTMVADMVRARIKGEPWAGLNVAAGPVLLLTEEGPMPTAWRWHRATGDNPSVTVLFRHEALTAWAEDRLQSIGGPAVKDDAWTFTAWITRRVREWIEGQRNPLVIVDTLATWGGIEDENSASEATAAISQWTRLAQDTGSCVLLVHHMRKSGGSNGEGIRGSSAILGTADGSWEVGRVTDSPTDTRRRIQVLSRMAFPTDLTMEYSPDTGAYSMAEDGPALGEIEDWLSIVPQDGEGRTMADLVSLWEVAKSTAYRRAGTLLNLGRLRREERSHGRATAWHHWAVPAAFVPRRPSREQDED
jgi:AAA domain